MRLSQEEDSLSLCTVVQTVYVQFVSKSPRNTDLDRKVQTNSLVGSVSLSFVIVIPMMDDYIGLVGMPVKQCKEEVMGSEMCMSGGIQVTSVMNDNNTKYGRCEGCGEHILDRYAPREKHFSMIRTASSVPASGGTFTASVELYCLN